MFQLEYTRNFLPIIKNNVHKLNLSSFLVYKLPVKNKGMKPSAIPLITNTCMIMEHKVVGIYKESDITNVEGYISYETK